MTFSSLLNPLGAASLLEPIDQTPSYRFSCRAPDVEAGGEAFVVVFN